MARSPPETTSKINIPIGSALGVKLVRPVMNAPLDPSAASPVSPAVLMPTERPPGVFAWLRIAESKIGLALVRIPIPIISVGPGAITMGVPLFVKRAPITFAPAGNKNLETSLLQVRSIIEK